MSDDEEFNFRIFDNHNCSMCVNPIPPIVAEILIAVFMDLPFQLEHATMTVCLHKIIF